MVTHSNRRTSWFITLPIVLGGVGFLWFAFIPTGRAIREIRNEIKDKEDFIAQSDTLHRNVAQLERQLNDVQQMIHEWHRQTPPPAQLAKLFGTITNHARQSGVTSTRFEPQQEVVLETIRRVPVDMELAGSYAEISQLLATLEQMPETVWIEELKLERRPEAGKDVKCVLKLEVFAGDFKESG